MSKQQRPIFEKRPWGLEAMLHRGRDRDNAFLVKHIVLHRDHNLSYHLHETYDKVWHFVSGIGIMILDDIRISVSEGSLYEIPGSVLHALRAIDRPLQLIEIQRGPAPLSEKDIFEIAVTWDEIRLYLQLQR